MKRTCTQDRCGASLGRRNRTGLCYMHALYFRRAMATLVGLQRVLDSIVAAVELEREVVEALRHAPLVRVPGGWGRSAGSPGWLYHPICGVKMGWLIAEAGHAVIVRGTIMVAPP